MRRALTAAQELRRAEITARILESLRSSGYETNQAIAEAIGVDRNTISKWRKGRSLPDVINLVSLAERTRRSADWLLYGAASPTVLERLAAWTATRKVKPSEEALAYLERAVPRGYVPDDTFFDLAFAAYSKGLTAEKASEAATETRGYKDRLAG